MSIHLELSFKATPKVVYEALTDAKRFSSWIGAPASGDPSEGAAFSAFGGHITGRHVELVADQRIVQAWRAKTWPAGFYSIARFELAADRAGTKLVFDHDGFPADMQEHLIKGWQSNYWDHLAKLGQATLPLQALGWPKNTASPSLLAMQMSSVPSVSMWPIAIWKPTPKSASICTGLSVTGLSSGPGTPR